MSEIQKEDIHILLQNFFKEKGLVRQHLDSYNDYIDHGLQEVVDEVREIPVEIPENPYKVKLGQIWVIDPQSRITGPYATEVDGTKHEIYPMEARLRNLAYAAPIALEMTPIIDGREQDTELVFIGNIPVMLKSKLCFLCQLSKDELVGAGEDPDDPGGYFIVNGSERVIVAMEDLAPNRIIVDIDTKGTKPVYQAKIFSTTVGFRARIQLRMKSDGGISVSIPGVPTEAPFVILLGVMFLKERFSRWETLGLVLSILGIVVMKLTLRFEYSDGFWLVLIGALFFGLTELMSKIAIRHVPPITLAFLRNLFMAPVYWLLFMLSDGSFDGLEKVWPGVIAL